MELLVDTHTHLDFAEFDEDRAEVFARARAAGVACFVNPAADLLSSRRAVELAATAAGVYAGVGVHPHYVADLTDEGLDALRQMCRQPCVVAIGEIGLDYYRDLSPRETQRRAFRQQLELAEEVGLPVIVHDRDAHEDVLEILAGWLRAGGRRGPVLFHAFSGDAAMARRVIELGGTLAVGGPVTFKNARFLPELLPELPAERLLLETDCPYLAPHPHRGQRNEPAYLPLVAERVAELLGTTLADLAGQTTRNAQAFFGLEVGLPEKGAPHSEDAGWNKT